jgi:hypothetical protein
MAFQNEEDYLDSLLKSVSSDGDSAPVQEIQEEVQEEVQEEIPQIDEAKENPVAQEPEEPEEPEESEEQEESEESEEPEVTDTDNSESWKDFATIGDVLEHETDIASELDDVNNQENVNVSDNSGDSDVDQYIQNLMNQSDEEFDSNTYYDKALENLNASVDDYIQSVPVEASENTQEPEQSDDTQEPEHAEQTEYIDITEEESDEYNDLLGTIDGIIADVEKETEQETQENSENPENPENPENEQEPVNDTQQEISFSDLNVDDELKELLGENDVQVDSNSASEENHLSEEELSKLAELEAGEDAQEELQDVSLPAQEQQDEDASKDKSLVKNEKKASKTSFLSKILSLFKKDKTEPSQAVEEDNENQQVLEELFDENGELKTKEKKVRKRGLFSKKPKSQEIVETPIEDEIDTEDLEDIPEDKPNKKKEKKKPKEKKPKKDKKPKKEKKPKKPKQPKVKKPKPPVNPNEIIHIKPAAVIVMIVITALISGGVYLFINSFIYEQAYDNATLYMLDKKYSYAYDEIAGVNPKTEEDEVFYEQVQVVMYLQKEYNSFENYFKMGLHYEAIDSLLKGLLAYDEYYQKASDLGVTVDFDNVKALLVSALEEKYGITESMARSYAAITDYEQYVYILESYGGKYQ